MTDPTGDILIVSDLTVRSGPKRRFKQAHPLTLLENVDLRVRRGASVGVVGPSGAGKSTLVKSIAGLLSGASGSVKFDGIELLPLSGAQIRPVRQRLQLVLQNVASLSPYHSVRSTLTEPLANFEVGPQEWQRRLSEAMSQMSLSMDLLDRYPGQLSGGQRQRVAIARALVLKPELVLFDEPVSSLDRVVQLSILEDLKRRQLEDETSYVIVTHDISVANFACDEIVTLNAGRLAPAAPD